MNEGIVCSGYSNKQTYEPLEDYNGSRCRKQFTFSCAAADKCYTESSLTDLEECVTKGRVQHRTKSFNVT